MSLCRTGNGNAGGGRGWNFSVCSGMAGSAAIFNSNSDPDRDPFTPDTASAFQRFFSPSLLKVHELSLPLGPHTTISFVLAGTIRIEMFRRTRLICCPCHRLDQQYPRQNSDNSKVKSRS